MPLMNQGLLTFVTILGVMERLCNFRLVLERKTGKEIPESSRLEFLEKVLANNFALSDAEDNNSSLLNRGGIYSRFTFVENTISNSPKVLRAKFLGVMDSFVLITSLSELYFRFRFILLVQMKKKKKISMIYGSSTSCWKPWRLVWFDLLLMMSGIYINSNVNPLTKFTKFSSRSMEFKDIIPWNIS